MNESTTSRKPAVSSAFRTLQEHTRQQIVEHKDLLRRTHLGDGDPLTVAEQQKVADVKRLLDVSMLGKEYWDLLELTTAEKETLGLIESPKKT